MAGENPNGWHLDKRVPVAIIVTIVIQIVGFGFLFGSHDSRIAELERRANAQDSVYRQIPERLARLEAIFERIESRLERIDDRLP